MSFNLVHFRAGLHKLATDDLFSLFDNAPQSKAQKRPRTAPGLPIPTTPPASISPPHVLPDTSTVAPVSESVIPSISEPSSPSIDAYVSPDDVPVLPQDDTKEILKSMKRWIAAEYDSEHKLAPQNPFLIDYRWFSDDVPSGMKLDRPPITLFYMAANEALGAEYSYNKNPPLRRIARRPDLDTFVNGLVTQSKALGRASGQVPEIAPVISKLNRKSKIPFVADRKLFPYADDLLTVFNGPLTDHLRDMYGDDAVDRSFASVLTQEHTKYKSDGTAIPGRRNDIHWLMNQGWKFLPQTVRDSISNTFKVNLDDDAERKRIVTQHWNEFSEQLEAKDNREAINARLSALIKLCADAGSTMHLEGLRDAPDLRPPNMDTAQRTSLVNAFSDAVLAMLSRKVIDKSKQLKLHRYRYEQKHKNIQPNDQGVGDTDDDFDVTTLDDATPRSQFATPSEEVPQDIEQTSKEKEQALLSYMWATIDKYIAPKVAQQFKEISNDIKTLGGVISSKWKATTNNPILPDMLKIYCDFLASEFSAAGDDPTRRRLFPILMQLAQEQGLLGEKGSALQVDWNAQIKLLNSNIGMANQRSQGASSLDKMFLPSKDKHPVPIDETLQNTPHANESITQVMNHNVYRDIWNRSPTQIPEPTTIEYPDGSFKLPSRNEIIRKVDTVALLCYTRLSEMLRHLVGDSMSAKELRLRRTELAKSFPRWSDFIISPEVMASSSAISRQVLMDSFGIPMAYKTGRDKNNYSIVALKYWYAGVYGIRNAPAAVIVRKSDKDRNVRPLMVPETTLQPVQEMVTDEDTGQKVQKTIMKKVPTGKMVVSPTLVEQIFSPVDAMKYIHKCIVNSSTHAKNANTILLNQWAKAVDDEAQLIRISMRMLKLASVDITHIADQLNESRKKVALLQLHGGLAV